MSKSPRILIVADDADQRTLFSLVLARAGFHIAACVDGKGALARLSRGAFDLILTDYLLPDIHGDELIRTLHDRHYPAKMVLMSNHLDVRTFARACNADGYFAKVDIAQLLAVVRAALA